MNKDPSDEKETNSYLEAFLTEKLNNHNNYFDEININQENEEIRIEKIKSLIENKNLLRIVKTIVFLIMVGFISLGRTYAIPTNPVACLNDPLHNLFTYFNDKIHQSDAFAGFFQISSSFLMDFTFFTIYLYWVLYIKSCRLVFTCILFYALRAFCQVLVQMRFPPGYYWDDPGFPSLVVPYGNTTDFFYSGHVGFLNISALEWYKHKMYKMSYLTIFIIVYMIFVLLIFRGHYSIDIITGLIASNWIFTYIDIYHERLNNFFFKAYKKMIKTYVN